jgi:hypothetical protein
MAWHDGGYGVLVDKLRVAIATQEHAKIIEPGDDALQFHAVDQENSKWNFVFTNEIEKCILQVLRPFCCHFL